MLAVGRLLGPVQSVTPWPVFVPLVTAASEDEPVPPTKIDRRGTAGEGRLAVPIAGGLALFLGANLIVALPLALSADAGNLRVWALVAGWILRYGGAIVVALCSFRLARRLKTRVVTKGQTGAHAPAATRRRHSTALAVVVIAGLIFMAAAELPVVLYQVGEASGSRNPFEAVLETVVVELALVCSCLGVVLAAVGTYLALRRLEDATASPQPESSTPSTQPVIDLDE